MFRLDFEVYGTVVTKLLDTKEEAQNLINTITLKAHRALVVRKQIGREWVVVAYNKYVTGENSELLGIRSETLDTLFTRVVYKTSSVNWHPYLSADLAMKDYRIIADKGVPVYLVDNNRVSLKANLGNTVKA